MAAQGIAAISDGKSVCVAVVTAECVNGCDVLGAREDD